MKIRELSISARAKMCLRTAGYEDIEDLENITDEELLKIRNLNEKGVAEIRKAINEYFTKEDDSDCFISSYPDRIQDICRKKEKVWEYRLFIEAVIYKYDGLQDYRNQSVVLWEYDDYLNRIEEIEEFLDFILLQMDKLQDFIEKITDCMNGDVNEAFGEPGDANKIISSVENLMQIYKDVITWKLSFGHIDVKHEYRNVIEQFYPLVDDILEIIDILYSKVQVAKKQFEDMLDGRISEEELYVDLNISTTLQVGGFKKALNDFRKDVQSFSFG